MAETRVLRLARILAKEAYGCDAWRQFNREERSIAIEEARQALRKLDQGGKWVARG